MEAQGHREFSGTYNRLTSAGKQLKSGSASHLVVREDNCGMAVRRTEWAIIGCCMFPQLRGDTLYPANHVSIKLLGRSARSAKTIKTCRRNVYYGFALKEKSLRLHCRHWCFLSRFILNTDE
ncbi:hypothetical protein FOXYSP1_19702 [Fusarium oxysporum f. sp. phaseoli]